ncbi:MAG: zinc ribbon domain-containing protein [Rubrobacteridae bacterium]|nr:zinc ribbon domain-containing protein [Rubrobacteridae bacterium]
MPTYQLVCDECGKDFEFFLTPFLKDSDKICPSCGSTKVRQVYRDFFGFNLSGGKSSGGSSDSGSGGCGSFGGFR